MKLLLALLLSPLLDKLLALAEATEHKPKALVLIVGINALLGSLAMQYRSKYQLKQKES